MNWQDLDTLIDTAAREMISSDPSRSMSDSVMSRVREPLESEPLGWSWAAGAAGVVGACAVLAILLVWRAPATRPVLQVPPSERPSARATEHQPVTLPAGPTVERPTPEPSSARAGTRRVLRQTVVSPARGVEAPTTPSLEPLAMEPIVLLALDLPSLENQPTIIDDIEIDDITIEPLTASSD